jgi:HK97 family phage major capsid protein
MNLQTRTRMALLAGLAVLAIALCLWYAPPEGGLAVTMAGLPLAGAVVSLHANPNTHSLRKKHAEALDAADSIAQAAVTAGRALTDQEKADIQTHRENAAGLAETITTAEELTAAKAASAVPVDQAAAAVPPRIAVHDRAADRPKGYNAVAFFLAQAGAELTRVKGHDKFGGKKNITAAQYAEVVMRDSYVASLHTGSIASGGGLVVERVSPDFIELLRANSVVIEAGAQTVDMPEGNLTVNRQDSACTWSWVGEQAGPNASTQTLGQVILMAKKGEIICPISNDLIRYAGERTVTLVMNDMANVARLGKDLAYLRGLGTANSPKGLLYWALAANKFNAQASPDLTKVTSDSGTLILKLANLNVPMDGSWRMFFAPRTFMYLANQRDSNGNRAWPEVEQLKTFRSIPFLQTTQIPINLGSGVDESENYLARMSDVIVGQGPVVPEEISSEASYNNSAGSLVSAFQRDETVIKLIDISDLAVRHPESVAVMEDVIWVP